MTGVTTLRGGTRLVVIMDVVYAVSERAWRRWLHTFVATRHWPVPPHTETRRGWRRLGLAKRVTDWTVEDAEAALASEYRS